MGLPTGRGNATETLGRLLVGMGLMTDEQLLSAVQEEERTGRALASYVVEMGLLTEQALARHLSEKLGVPLATAEALEEITRDAVTALPSALAERHRLIPLRVQGDELHVGLADPRRLDELEEVGGRLGRTLRPWLVTETALGDALEEHYGIRPDVRMFREGKAPPPTDNRARRLKKVIARTGVFAAFSPQATLAPPSTDEDLLATASSSAEVLNAAVSAFADIFPGVITLGINKGRANVLLLANRETVGPPSQPMGLTLPDGSVLRAVLDRPQVAHHATADGSLAALCRKLNVPVSNLTVVPVFDFGRPALVVIGQGLDERQIADLFGNIKALVTRVSVALRRVSPRTKSFSGESGS
jgi:hypothetical protein